MKLNILTLLIATFSTGIMAGLFFIWTNTVKPGIGKLSDLVYLESFQSMNRVILNPIFQGLFIAAMLFMIITTFLNYNNSAIVLRLLIASSIIYGVGVFLVTFFGNVPLNNILENSDLNSISGEDAKQLRATIEAKWNNLNLVRTITSCISFALLLLAVLKVK